LLPGAVFPWRETIPYFAPSIAPFHIGVALVVFGACMTAPRRDRGAAAPC